MKQQMQQQQSRQTVLPPLDVAVLGHCGAGKSLLVGRLANVSADEITRLAGEVADRGLPPHMAYVWAVDRSQVERIRRLTVDPTAFGMVLPDGRRVLLHNLPGHSNFRGNALRSIQQCHAAVVVVSGDGSLPAATARFKTTGVVEGGIRFQCRAAKMLGISQFAVVINRAPTPDRFSEVVQRVKIVLRSIGFSNDELNAIPFVLSPDCTVTSNFAWTKTDRTTNPDLASVPSLFTDFFRFPEHKTEPSPFKTLALVNTVLSNSVCCAKVTAGSIATNEQLAVVGSTGTVCAKQVKYDKTTLSVAKPSYNVGLQLSTKKLLPSVGDALVHPLDIPKITITNTFRATVLFINVPDKVRINYSIRVFLGSRFVQCRVSQLLWKYSLTLHKQLLPASVRSGELASVVFEANKDVFVQPFRSCRALGAVIGLMSNEMVCFGRVEHVG